MDVMRWTVGLYLVNDQTALDYWTIDLVCMTAGGEVGMATFNTSTYLDNANITKTTTSFSHDTLGPTDLWVFVRLSATTEDAGGLYLHGCTLWVQDIGVSSL